MSNYQSYRGRLCSRSLGLPAITNYEYEENTRTRGPENRNFRFRDVCSESTYLFQEITTDGRVDLEDYGVTEGQTLVTTDNLGLYTVTGETIQGAFDQGETFNYPNVSGQVIRSIEGATSFLIFPVNTTSSIASVSYTGITLDQAARFQAYVQARVYGDTSTTNTVFMVEGYTGSYDYGNNGVAYMNYGSSSWSASRPGSNGISLQSGITELTINFYTQDFPGDTPDYYALTIGSFDSASPPDYALVVDDFHIDQYMKQNAFTDVLVPSGYILEVTPDIGWHDTLSMFGERDNFINPHLKTLGPFTLNSGVIDNQDGTMTIVPADNEIDDALSSNYRNYLWRVIPIAYNGTPGPGGLPRRFEYVGRVFEEEFKITNIDSDPLSVVKIIEGIRSPRMKVLVDGNLDYKGLEYPTATTWKLTIVLDKAYSRIMIQGKDIDGAVTKAEYVELENKYAALKEQALWNVFDEHGLLVDLKRIPGEQNEEFSKRIQKMVGSPGLPTYNGVLSAGSISLGLNKIEQALSIKLKPQEISNAESLIIDVTSSEIVIRTSDLVTTENLIVDPVYLTATLAEAIYDEPINVEIIGGGRVSADSIYYFDEDSERPDYKKIRFTDNSVGGKGVRITYPYYRVYKYSDYPTLAELYNAIKEFTNSVGFKCLAVELNTKLSGSEKSSNLQKTNQSVLAGNTIDVSWSFMSLNRISDRIYRESFRNADGSLWNTKFYSYVQELKSSTNIEWGHIIADKAYWDAADNRDEGFDHLPTLCDPPISRYLTLTGSKEISSLEADYRDRVGYLGEKIYNSLIAPRDFIPGVAHTYDLEPGIYTAMSSSPELRNQVDLVADAAGSDKVVFFSGQITGSI